MSVFDLKALSADFSLELLKCLLKSISAAKGNPLDTEMTWYKLKYIMLWGRDELVHEQLKEVLNEGVLSTDFYMIVHEESLAWLTCPCLCFVYDKEQLRDFIAVDNNKLN